MQTYGRYLVPLCLAHFLLLPGSLSKAADNATPTAANQTAVLDNPAAPAPATDAQTKPKVPAFATAGAKEWQSPAANSALTRYSSLSDINTQNVSKLASAFSFSMGVNRGQEAAPIVAGSTLYVVGPYPNVLYALDLSQPGATPIPAKRAGTIS